MATLHMTEASLQEAVASLAHVYRWRVAHFRAAVTGKGFRTPVAYDGKGFPDLILVRRPFVLAVELKADAGFLDDDQERWCNAFANGVVPYDVWTPREFADGTIARVLKDGPPPNVREFIAYAATKGTPT